MVQVGHACLEAGQRFAQPSGGNNLVVLQVPSQAELLHAIETLSYHGIQCVTFCEPDDGLQETAACTETVSGAKRLIFRRFALWGAGHKRGPPLARHNI